VGTDLGETKLLIADTRRLFAEALGIALREYPQFDVIDHYPSHGREVVNVVDLHRPDIVLLDYWIGEMQGPTVARLIQKRLPACRVVLLSWFLNPTERKRAVEFGVEAVVAKDVEIDELVDVVRRLSARGGPTGRERPWVAGPGVGAVGQADEDVLQLEGLISLTPREIDILTLLAFRPTDIAATLKISEKTVRHHVQNILGKTRARSAVEAVAMARRHGLL